MTRRLQKELPWDERARGLRRWHALLLGGAAQEGAALLKMLRAAAFTDALAALLAELRSQLVREVCAAVAALAAGIKACEGERVFEGFVAEVLLPEVLKAAVKSNHAIASLAHACALTVVKDVASVRVLRVLVAAVARKGGNSKVPCPLAAAAPLRGS